MNRLDYLWKGVIEDYFPYFMDYFYPKKSEEIDFAKGFTFLNQELNKILPESKTRDRRSDVLVKVVMKTGEIQYLLIHIEVQGYVDQEFDFRMFVSYYRIFDKLKLPLKALAIYVDGDANYHPKEYRVADNGWGTEVIYKFKTYKLLDQKIEDLKKSDNPFGIIMATAWYAIYKNRPKTDEGLLDIKIELFRELFSRGYEKEEIADFLSFVRQYSRFKKQDFYLKFDDTVQIITKNNKPMGIQEAIIYTTKLEGIEIGKEEGREEGIEIGKEEGIEIGRKKELDSSIKKILSKGHSPKVVADMLDISVEYVEELNKTLGEKED